MEQDRNKMDIRHIENNAKMTNINLNFPIITLKVNGLINQD